LKYTLLLLLAFFLIDTHTLSAQRYNLAAGVRVGTEIGATITPRVSKKSTLEGIVQYSNLYHSTRASLLWRQHQGILGKRVNIYIGAGPGWGWYHAPEPEIPDVHSYNLVAVFGVEATFGRLNVSWDYKPVYAAQGPRTFYSETAVSMRYVIAKRKWQPFKGKNKKKKKKKKKKGTFWERVF
jgi:hypothetical protein